MYLLSECSSVVAVPNTEFPDVWTLTSFTASPCAPRSKWQRQRLFIPQIHNNWLVVSLRLIIFHRNNSSVIGYIIDPFKRCLAFLGLSCHNSCKKILDNNGDYFPSWLKPYNYAKTDKITMYTTYSTMETTPRFFSTVIMQNHRATWKGYEQ